MTRVQKEMFLCNRKLVIPIPWTLKGNCTFFSKLHNFLLFGGSIKVDCCSVLAEQTKVLF